MFKGVYFYYYQTLYLRKVQRPITLNIIITTETEKTSHKSIFKILGNLNSPPSFFPLLRLQYVTLRLLFSFGII